jgi:hypothetical protein
MILSQADKTIRTARGFGRVAVECAPGRQAGRYTFRGRPFALAKGKTPILRRAPTRARLIAVHAPPSSLPAVFENQTHNGHGYRRLGGGRDRLSGWRGPSKHLKTASLGRTTHPSPDPSRDRPTLPRGGTPPENGDGSAGLQPKPATLTC